MRWLLHVAVAAMLLCQAGYAHQTQSNVSQTANVLSVARGLLAATSVGNLAFFAGGCIHSCDNGQTFNVVDVFHLDIGLWSTMNLSVARYGLTAASVGSLAIFAGGCDFFDEECHQPSAIVDLFDTATNQWHTAELSVARYYSAVVTVGQCVLFAGGQFEVNGSVVFSAVVDIFNSSSNQWVTTQLSLARESLAVTSVDSYAFFAGGRCSHDDTQCNYDRTTAVVDMFDLSSHQWFYLKLSESRANIVAVSIGKLAIFAGGYLDSGDVMHGSSTVDIFDVSKMQWSTAQLNTPRANIAAVSLGVMAIFAGGDDNSHVSDVVDIFDSSTGSWSVSNLSQARSFFGATTDGNVAVFAGGCYRDLYGFLECYDTVDVYINNSTMRSLAPAKISYHRD